MINDLRFAVRQLLKAPAFSLSAILVLACGIGANAAIFSLLDTLLLRPPAYPQAQEIVQIFSQDRKDPKKFRGFSYPTYRDLREQNSVFAGVLAHNLAMVGVGEQGNTRRTFADIVSSNYFSVLGVAPIQGRTFTDEEEKPGSKAAVAIVSYRYWQKQALSPGLLGSEIQVNGRPFTVIGILPAGFTGTMNLFSPEIWVPLGVYEQLESDFQSSTRTTLDDRAGQQLLLIARLKAGVTAAAAAPALQTLAANLEQAFPVEQKDQTFMTAPLSRLGTSTAPSSDSEVSALGPLLFGMAAVVLLVACLNLANMLLARGTARRKEIAVRLALGASRWRIVRQLLVEGFVLALAGGAGGLFLGLWSSDLLVASLGRMMPFDLVWAGGLDSSILLATLGFCVLGTLGFALGPAMKISRGAVLGDLKEHPGEDAVRRRWKFLPRNPLVVVQIAFSLALLTAATLFIRGAFKAASVKTGLQTEQNFLVEVDASLAGYDQARGMDLYRQLEERLAALPGVEHASIAGVVPFGMVTIRKSIQRGGVHPPADAKPATPAEGLAFSANLNSVGADYFATVGLPVRRGRAFSAAEAMHEATPRVAIIDEVLAKKLWPDGDALGQQIQSTEKEKVSAKAGAAESVETTRVLEVVGIVPYARHSLFEKNPPGAIYLPFAGGYQGNVFFHLRFAPGAAGDVTATADVIRRAVRQVDSVLPILSLKTFAQHLEANIELWLVRAGATLFSVFGLVALGLAVVGVYGVKAYSVARRTREIGIRMALGARRETMQWMILREGLVMLASGIVLGLLLAAATGKLLAGILYEVGAFDPLAFALAPLVLAAAALLATWLPARRATRISPMAALRTE